MEENSVFKNGIDKELLNNLVDKVNLNTDQLNEIVEMLVKEYCSELDKLMKNINDIVFNKEITVTDEELEYLVMQLPCVMYFTSSIQEELGLKEDISRVLEKEVYHRTIMETVGTVSMKESTALLQTQYQSLITTLNSRIYKKIKSRMDYALETLGSLKKVLQYRISSLELSMRDKN